MCEKHFRLLQKQVDEAINAATVAASQGGMEICGLLIDNGYFIELIATKNKIKKGGSFAFNTREIRLIQKSASALNHEIIGTFHSHPFYIDEPSESDIKNTLDNSIMLIIDVTGRKVGVWHIKDDNKKRVEFTIIDAGIN